MMVFMLINLKVYYVRQCNIILTHAIKREPVSGDVKFESPVNPEFSRQFFAFNPMTIKNFFCVAIF